MTRRITTVEQDLRETPRRWLVTGGCGFIGSHLVERLLELGQRVVVLDNLATGSIANLDDVRQRIEFEPARLQFIEGDIRDPQTCRTAVDGADFVLHQAALGSVPRSLAHPDDTHTANVDGFVNVALAAKDAKVRSVVYASSSSVYGDSEKLPKQEDEIGEPLSPYALSKRVNELYAANYARCFDLQIIGLRYFNVFGPRQDPEGPYAAVIPRWLAALAAGQSPVIFGDGETSRDFCPVANVVQANLLAAAAGPDLRGAVYNIALGDRTTLAELFTTLRDAMAAAGAPCAGLEPTHEDFRPGDVRHSLADISRAQTELGYESQVGFEEGVRRTVAGFVGRNATPDRELA